MAQRFPHGFVLSLASPGATVVKPVRFENGVPVYRFRKELIHCGSFTTAEGEPFTVDEEAIRHWADTFAAMQRNGVAVPVPADHDKTDSEHQHGFLVGAAAEGPSLVGTIELYGADAPRLAASNNVSIYAEPEWTDGAGNRYVWPIRHVALTPDPRIPGLAGFVPIAASNPKRTMQVPLLRMDSMPQEMNVPMPGEGAPLPTDSTAGDPSAAPADEGASDKKSKRLSAKQIKDHYLDKASAVMADNEMDHKQKLAEIGALLKRMEDMLKDFVAEEEAEEGEGGSPAGVASEGPEGAAMCGTSRAAMSNRQPASSVLAARAQATAPVHPELIRLSSENRKMRIENLFRDGKISKHQKDCMLGAYTTSAAVSLALSNKAAETSFEQTLLILEANPRVVPDEKTGQQIVLSNKLVGPTDDDLKRQADEEEKRWRTGRK